MFYFLGRRQIRRAESASCENLNITSPVTSPILQRKESRDTPSPDSANESPTNGRACHMRQISCPAHGRQDSRLSLYSLPQENGHSCKVCLECTREDEGLVGRHQYTDIKPELIKILSPQTKFDKLPSVVNGLRFSYSGDLLISDSGNKKVKVFDSEGQLKVECSVPGSYGRLKEPAGLCQLRNGQIIVADHQAGDLKVFTSEGRLLTTFGQDLQKPRDVCTNTWGHVIVTDEGLKDLLLYRSLADKSVIQLNKALHHRHIQTPCHVTTVRDDCILVSDSAKSTAVLYDSFGHHLNQVPIVYEDFCSLLDCRHSTRGCDRACNQRRDHPLARDHESAALVADYSHSCVVRVDLRRHILSKVILDSTELQQPVAISTHPSGLLAVQEEGTTSIKLFRYLKKT